MDDNSSPYADDIALHKQISEDAAEVAGIGVWLYHIASGEVIFQPGFYSLLQADTQAVFHSLQDCIPFVHKDDRDKVAQHLAKMLTEHVVGTISYRIICGNGITKFIKQRTKLLAGSNGSFVILGAMQDVTEQHLMEQRLREANEKLALQNQAFSQAQEIAMLASWQLNLHTREVIYSDNLYRLYGLEPGEVPKDVQYFLPYIHPEDKPTFETAILEMQEEHKPFDIRYCIIRKDGELRYVRQRCKLHINEDSVPFMIGALQDFTFQQQAREKLQKSETLLREAEKISGIGSWERNLTTHELVWSDELYRIYGYEPGAVKPDTDFFINHVVHPDDIHIGLQLIERTYRQDAAPAVFRIRRPDGEVKVVRAQPSMSIDDDGKTQYVRGVVKDITDELAMNDKLNLAYTQIGMQSQVNNYAEQIAELGTWWWYPDTNKTIYSDNMFRLLGLEPQSVAPGIETLPLFIHPDDREMMLQRVADMKQSEQESVNVEYRVFRSDGILRYMRNRSRLIFNDGSRVYLGTMQDITEEVMLRQQITEGKQFAEMLTDASIDRILAFDKDMCITAWNKTVEQLSGIKKEEVMGIKLLERFPKMKEDEVLHNAIYTALNGAHVFLPARKGVYMKGYFESYFIPLRDKYKKVQGVLNIMHDVTHTIQIEQELKAANKSLIRKNRELKHRNAELASFSYIASHDLKEPLRKIYTFIEMILTREADSLSEPGTLYFKRVQASVQRMGLLINDILTFTQLNTEKQTLAEVDLNHTLMMVKNNLADILATTNTVIECDSLPVIKGYRNLLMQLFQNLISNAVKFQEPGNTPRVNIQCATFKGNEIDHPEASADSDYLLLSFRDNGIGFEDKFSDRIFQMFKRLHNNERYPGTGIGLALCRKIAEMHNGFITASSTLRRGSTFNCYLQIQ